MLFILEIASIHLSKLEIKKKMKLIISRLIRPVSWRGMVTKKIRYSSNPYHIKQWLKNQIVHVYYLQQFKPVVQVSGS